MHLFLVHHGQAVAVDIDTRQPLSAVGRASVDRVATLAASRGARPLVVWHSGKLRAKQTADAYWKICNALAEFSVQKDLQPADPPQRIRDRILAESRDLMIAGHFPNLPRLVELLAGPSTSAQFPAHGVVALATNDEGATWRELWRIDG